MVLLVSSQQQTPQPHLRKESIWQAKVATNRQGVQQRFPIRGLDEEPMVDREVRASRFVSQLAGHTEKLEPLLHSNRQRRWQQGVRKLPVVPVQEQLQLLLWGVGSLVPPTDQPSH